MRKNIIEEAIANIALTSEAIDKFCADPNSRCSPYAADLLEKMSWELSKQATELEEIKYYLHFNGDVDEQDCGCSECMYCLGLSWKDFL
jgi:hypothetical protein